MRRYIRCFRNFLFYLQKVKQKIFAISEVSKEFIIAKSPEIIIEIGPTANLSSEGILNRKKSWTIYPTINAVKNDRLYFVGADYILIPGPRLVKILDILTRNIHPKLFPITANIKQEITSQ